MQNANMDVHYQICAFRSMSAIFFCSYAVVRVDSSVHKYANTRLHEHSCTCTDNPNIESIGERFLPAWIKIDDQGQARSYC